MAATKTTFPLTVYAVAAHFVHRTTGEASMELEQWTEPGEERLPDEVIRVRGIERIVKAWPAGWGKVWEAKCTVWSATTIREAA